MPKGRKRCRIDFWYKNISINEVGVNKMSKAKNVKALIMTIGLPADGEDFLDVLLLDLEELKPERLVMVCSRQSQANAEKMLERSGLTPEATDLVVLDSANNINDIFRQANTVVKQLIADGYANDEIAINYTSGTKVMGAGLVLCAVYNRIRELRYITGLGATHAGSKHRMLTTSPGAVFAYRDLMRARNTALMLQFRSCRDILTSLDTRLLAEDDCELYKHLELLINAYGQWDEFHADEFLKNYDQCQFDAESLQAFKLGENQRGAIEALGKEMIEGEFGPYLITDLYNNAVRRWIVGRCDDAIARLYRAMEMLAQWVLMREFEIDTNNIQVRRIPPRDRVTFEALRSIEDGKVRVGLRKAFDLLAILEAKVGQKFTADPVMQEFLQVRSQTILAHGLKAASREDCERFIIHSRDLFKTEIENFSELSHQLQFPWLVRSKDYSTVTIMN